MNKDLELFTLSNSFDAKRYIFAVLELCCTTARAVLYNRKDLFGEGIETTDYGL